MQGFYSDSSNYCAISFLTSDRLDFIDQGGTGARKITTAKFRDLSAWYHICVAVDSTLGTANDRIKMYVNGVLETVFDTNSAPSQNANLGVNLSTQAVGVGEGGDIGYLQGYLAESVYIDGTQNDVTDFGEFDEDSGIWKPIDVSGLTFGNNGFYLDFENSGALGADVSGNGNNFTVNNLTAVDQSTDTCTNNYSTYNPLQPAGSNTFTNGNLTVTTATSGGHGPISTFAIPKSGKWYWEVKIDTTSGNISDNLRIGMEVFDINNLTNPGLGDIRYISNATKNVDGSNSSYGASYGSNNDIIGVAVDSDGNSVEFFKNGSSQGSISYTQNSNDYFAVTAEASGSVTATYSFNFGSPSFTISSGNTDGNGYGNFEYAVPSGYYALNTKNLAEYG
jgi:hypothetical protein